MGLSEILTFTTIATLAVISPGPDFAVVVKNSLTYSKKSGILTALGISLGLVIHITYSFIGLGFIIAQSIFLFNLLKYLGAVYLIYIGFQSLETTAHHNKINISSHKKKEITDTQSLLNGLLTNALNPRVTLFFLGVFTQIIQPNTPLIIKMFYGAEMMVIAFSWFSLLAIILSHSFIKNRIGKIQSYSGKIMGMVLILLGIKVALSTN